MNMKRIRALLALLLTLALCAAAPLATADTAYAALGQPLADFTVETCDGGTFTLSEALREKEMVLINLWATWCGPCEMEFPYLEDAYEQFQEKVEVIALSVEPTDTNDVLTEYAEAHGLTFPVANGVATGLGDAFALEGIPTSLVVDRFGNLAFLETGAQVSESAFPRLFSAFIGEGYTETAVLEEIPPMLPNVDAAEPEALAAALNGAGGEIDFENPGEAFVWPMLPEEKDGRAVLASTNAGQDETVSAVYANFTSAAGEALAFTFATSTEGAMDMLRVVVDDAVVKSFGGEHDWTEWVLALEPGGHTVGFEYVKDYYDAAGEDRVWLDEVRLVSADEAETLLAALPVNPTAETFEIVVTDESAREIAFAGDELGLLEEYFSCQSYWIVPGEEAEAIVYLTGEIDPEEAFGYSNYDGAARPLAAALVGDGYALSTPVDSVETSGYSYTNLYAYPTADVVSYEEIRGVMLFADEENVNAFVQEMEAEGLDLTWAYVDGAAPATDAAASGAEGAGEYTVLFVDQDGAPVPGCVINFCTDEMCQPVVADANGVATFSGEPYAYHLQVIKVPEGYEFDTAQEFTADPSGGELSFTVVKK